MEAMHSFMASAKVLVGLGMDEQGSSNKRPCAKQVWGPDTNSFPKVQGKTSLLGTEGSDRAVTDTVTGGSEKGALVGPDDPLALRENNPPGSSLHYLDDFLFIGKAGSSECSVSLIAFQHLSPSLGVPVAPGKTQGPTKCLTFLGIEIDSPEGMCRMPEDKVIAMKADIRQVLSRDKATLSTTQSLLGRLNFAARIIPAGRIFARRLARATVKIKKAHHMVCFSAGLKEDLRMWLSFLEGFNGALLWRTPWCTSQQLQLVTDALGREGFGAILDREWCAVKWPNAWRKHGLTKNITVLEMFPIVLSLHVGKWVIGRAVGEIPGILPPGDGGDDAVQGGMVALGTVEQRIGVLGELSLAPDT
ncbi:hypothetical protein NDU88_006103 [Pleurodeles waltl]|uniref:Uncharacterized protein n=1 Tax=Pleurodeles waltl TaxID=8319 RepID=A0AAV7SNU3_PLEWA|nr:hypothetical protein NDU88_006103 [Pleurodeles waltl]